MTSSFVDKLGLKTLELNSSNYAHLLCKEKRDTGMPPCFFMQWEKQAVWGLGLLRWGYLSLF
jgi:hypothetical protein